MYNSLLETFITAADCGSLSKAAEKLFLSPTAVMKQLNLLENHLNLKLIERTNHGVRLTECGESIYRDAKFMISYSQKAVERAREIAGKKCQVIRVGTSMLNPCKPFMDIWFKLSDRFPNFKIQIVPFEDDHRGILSVIERIGTDFDFIIGVCDSAMWLDRCNFLKLGAAKKCVAVPMGHRLAARRRLKISDLHGETLMMVRRGDSPTNDRLRDFLEREHPQICIEDTEQFYDISVFNRCAQTGKVLLNLECWKDVHPSLVTVPVEWDYAIPYGILYPMKAEGEILGFLGEIEGHFSSEKK